METVVQYLLANGDLKILVIALAWIGWHGMRQITGAIDRIREDMDKRQTVDMCDEKHGHSCARLDVLEKKVDKRIMNIAEIRGKVDSSVPRGWDGKKQ